ncbi:unnamed protein product [marine sediment metagenome]|uniref:Uncharacterized protein n=1 Tax=marine sediment metagenome TaxID=412755 RepID=X1QT81_9ZZZZ
MKIITLQRAAVCADCGAELPAGTRARYYSADRIYCESHDEKPAPRKTKETEPLFQDDSPDIEAWIQFLEEVREALTNLIGRLKR